MKDLTMLVAHADDEAIFLWPFLARTKKIICASSDANNPARAWCKRRGECLLEVGKLIGAEVSIHHNDSEFYRAETRPEPRLKNIAGALLADLAGSDIVATHNAWGEYGHVDHILCHYVARTYQASSGCDLLVTDIAQEINWLPVRPWAQGAGLVPGNRAHPGDFYTHYLDRLLFDRIHAIYEAKGCWTWSHEPVDECRVFSL